MRYAIMGTTVQQVRSAGGTDIKETRRTGITFATLTGEQAARLKAVGCSVNKVGAVRPVAMPPTVAPPTPVAAAPTYTPEQLVWAAGLEELRGVTEPPLYGEGMNLAIIDSGIRETHENIKGRVVHRKNYTSDPMRDGFNHGTSVCSVALAVAPLCNILNLRVLDDEGLGTEEGVVLAIDDCIDLCDTEPSIAPTVINLSLGSPDDGNSNNPMRVACRAAMERGIWILAAAGNEGPTPGTIICPACEQYVFAIGSAKYEPFIISDWSSRGPTKEGLVKPDAISFGEDVVMASSESDTATIAKSGTSFSLPFCSGMIIVYHEGVLKLGGVEYPAGPPPGLYPELTELVSIENLMDVYLAGVSAKPEGVSAGKDNDYGYGVPLGPLIAQSLRFAPAMDISTILTPMMLIAVLGMMTAVMTKTLK